MSADVLPEFVRHPDGLTEPFEPERITRSLFAAAERLGPADAFLARELTEGVLHFLGEDRGTPEIAIADLVEVIGKIVRELGQPALASEYLERRHQQEKPTRKAAVSATDEWPAWMDPMLCSFEVVHSAARAPLQDFAFSHLFSRDLVSAHKEGLIRIGGLSSPMELSGTAMGLSSDGVFADVFRARQIAGEFIAIDGPEYDLALLPGEPAALADRFINHCREAALAAGTALILNLNCNSPPLHLASVASPLFEGSHGGDHERRQEIARLLADHAPDSSFTVWWHASSEDRNGPTVLGRARALLAGGECEFVFDRPRGPVRLGPGLDRQTPTMLLQVGINLARLVDLVGGAPVDSTLLLRKVGSLTRFAKTAGHAKQDFLRRHGRSDIGKAFRLDRATLVLVPMGLKEAARASTLPPAEFAREILKAIRTAAETDRPRSLPVRVDSPLGGRETVSVVEESVTYKQQVRSASVLHGVIGGGRFDLLFSAAREEPTELCQAVELACDSNVARMAIRKETAAKPSTTA